MLYSIIWCWVTCVRLQAPQQHDGAQEEKFWGGSNWAERREHAFSALHQVEYFSNQTRSTEEYCNIQTERRWALFFNSLHSHRRFRLWSLHKRHLLGVMNMNLGRLSLPEMVILTKSLSLPKGFFCIPWCLLSLARPPLWRRSCLWHSGYSQYWKNTGQAWMSRILCYIIYYITYSCLH